MHREVDRVQSTVDPKDLAAVEAYRRLLDREKALRDYVQETMRGDYAARIAQYNASVQQYNDMCAKRQMPKANIEAASRNLQCPDFPPPAQ
jgi:hypothetical protein